MLKLRARLVKSVLFGLALLGITTALGAGTFSKIAPPGEAAQATREPYEPYLERA